MAPGRSTWPESDLKIAVDTVLARPDEHAPVSSLYLFGRKEDLAFEQPVGDNPRHRHHVRFWKPDKLHEGRPVWVGSAIYDQHVGFSRDTGQITHVTAPDIDNERDYLFEISKRPAACRSVKSTIFTRCAKAATAAATPGTRMDDFLWESSKRDANPPLASATTTGASRRRLAAARTSRG